VAGILSTTEAEIIFNISEHDYHVPETEIYIRIFKKSKGCLNELRFETTRPDFFCQNGLI